MPSLRERGGRWYLTICQDGRRREVAVGNNERLARLRLDEVEIAIERGKAGFPAERAATLAEQIDRWLAGHGRTLAPSTLARCRIYAERALELLPGERPLTRDALVRYQGQRLDAGRKAKGVNNETAWIQQVARDDSGRLPWAPVRPLKIRDAHQVRWLTHDEVARLLAAARPQVRPYLLGYLFTGARREELVSVAWEDWDRGRGAIRLPNLKTAGRRPGDSHRLIPVHPRLRAVLEAQEALGLAQPWPRPSSLHQLLKWVVAAAGRAGIAPVPRLHDLRHTFASHLVQAGVSLYVVGKLLGHTSPATTAIYSHLSPATFEAAVGLLDYGATGQTDITTSDSAAAPRPPTTRSEPPATR